jgi:hypothetical protein
MTHERHLSILYSIQIKRPDIIVRGGMQETLQQTGAKKHQRSAIGQLLQSRQKEHPTTSRRVTERPSPGKKKHPERPPKWDQQAETKLRILKKPSTHFPRRSRLQHLCQADLSDPPRHRCLRMLLEEGTLTTPGPERGIEYLKKSEKKTEIPNAIL